MPDSVTIDSVTVDKWINRFHDELGVAVNRMLRYEMRLCLADCIRHTGPKSLSAGREKVKKDLSRAATPLNSDVIRTGLARKLKGHQSVDVGGNQIASSDVFSFTMDRANDLIKRRDYAGMNALLKNIGGHLADWQIVPFTSDMFTSASRGPNGGIKSQRKFVFETSAFRRAVSHIQSHIGRLKAGWLPAYYAVGGSQVASWVNRHFVGARGGFSNSDSVLFPRIESTNRALGVGRSRDIVNKAIHVRAGSIRRDFFQFLNGKKDLAQIT